MPRRVLLFAVIAVLILGLAWWRLYPQREPEQKSAAAQNAALSQSNLAPASPPTIVVEMPKVAPAPLSPYADARDPQENLPTALADVARLVKAGDFLALWGTYGEPAVQPYLRERIAANVKTLQARYANNTAAQASMQNLSLALEAVKNQEPTYNEARDQATFQIGPETHPGLVPSITFVKIDGRWYLTTGTPGLGW